MWRGRTDFLVMIVLAAVFTLSTCSLGDGGAGKNRIEVFSWWVGAGEADGLNAMVADFKEANPGIEFANATVSGGAGSNAKALLASRLLAGDPPDSYQRHAGLELQDDVASGKVQDLTRLYEEQGWLKVVPQGLLDGLTINDKIYAVPVNIHRANLIWYSPSALRSLGIEGPPRSWREFLGQAAAIRAKGKTALALGPSWTQKHLLETVLLGELGPAQYEQLWRGQLGWSTPEVRSALEIFKQVLGFSDVRSAAADWQPQLDQVFGGGAVYAVMGDWASSYLSGAKKLPWQYGYNVAASPGTDGVFDFLSDSFTLPVGARRPDLAKKWLVECGSRKGQDLFNPKKGSIPVRTDANPLPYQDYLAWSLKQWRDPETRIVGSLTHGVVANNALNAEIDTALGLFAQDGDTAKFAATVARKYQETR